MGRKPRDLGTTPCPNFEGKKQTFPEVFQNTGERGHFFPGGIEGGGKFLHRVRKGNFLGKLLKEKAFRKGDAIGSGNMALLKGFLTKRFGKIPQIEVFTASEKREILGHIFGEKFFRKNFSPKGFKAQGGGNF